MGNDAIWRMANGRMTTDPAEARGSYRGNANPLSLGGLIDFIAFNQGALEHNFDAFTSSWDERTRTPRKSSASSPAPEFAVTPPEPSGPEPTEVRDEIPESGFRDLDGNVYDSTGALAAWRGPKNSPHPQTPPWMRVYAAVRKGRKQREQQVEEHAMEDGFRKTLRPETP